MIQASSPFERLPLPTAALVIDVRGDGGNSDDNYILSTLKYEIGTLCQEMCIERINQWRFLTSIIDYMSIGKLSSSELQNYREPYKAQTKGENNVYSSNTSITPEAPVSSNNNPRRTKTLMGSVKTQSASPHHFFRNSPQRRSLDEIPEGNFKNSLRKILSTCDILRTKRVNATIDLGPQGSPGLTRSGEGTVRLIFIADAQSEDSLATAATYAAYLRRETLFQGISELQILLSVTVICLNHDNRGEAPRMLIEALSWGNDITWPHIDSCILTETYSEHGAKISPEEQEEHIEFLLYVLLITDPSQLRIDIHSPDITALMQESVKCRMLPVEKCFSIGISSFTYSVRWGRHLLNSSFTEHLAQVLTDRPQSLPSGNKVAAQRWFDDQLATVENAIPALVAGNMPELNAITKAEAVVKPANAIFPSRSLSVRIGKRSLQALDQYASDLEETYTTSTPSLQDAVNRKPTIPEYVARWQGDAGSPLMRVLTNAYRVLIDQRFFDKSSSKGAISRAQQQLKDLAAVIAERQAQHQGHVIDPAVQRDNLHKQYETERQSLEDLNKQFPLLGKRFKGIIATLSLLLWFFIILVASLAGMAWLHNLVFLHAEPILTLFDQEIFGLFNVFNLITVVVVLALLTMTVYTCIRTLFDAKVSSMRVETALLISLGIFSLFGLIVSFSLTNLVGDTVALGLISWLAPLPYISILTFLIGIIVVVVELGYFLKWHGDMVRERNRIVEDLSCHHKEAIETIRQHLAETFLISLFQRAALIDETGKKEGRYFTAIEQLHLHLRAVQEQAKRRYQMIDQHLQRITENQTQGPASSKLYLREELLDITALTSRLVTLEDGMHTQPYFIELTELLLRSLSAEATDMIIRDVEQRPYPTSTFLMDNDQHEAHLLFSLIAAEALELSIEQPPLTLPSTDLLESRYKALDYHYQHTAIGDLISQLKSRIAVHLSKNKKQTQDKADTELATAALAAWTQVFWERDKQLQDVLTQEGVLARMMRKNYSPETMRAKFIIRVAPLNRSLYIGQQTDTYLVTFPANRGSKLLRELDMAYIPVKFPDEELLALLSLSHYVSMPYKIEEEPVAQAQLESASSTNNNDSTTDGAESDTTH